MVLDMMSSFSVYPTEVSLTGIVIGLLLLLLLIFLTELVLPRPCCYGTEKSLKTILLCVKDTWVSLGAGESLPAGLVDNWILLCEPPPLIWLTSVG